MVTWTQQDVDTLKAACTSGVLTVNYAGPPARSITYQSMEQMLKVLAIAAQSVRAQAGGANYVLAGTRKGF